MFFDYYTKGGLNLVKNFFDMDKNELLKNYEGLLKDYENFKSKNLKLDMSRGKPSSQQLDLSMRMLDELNSKSDFKTNSGLDVRNYGVCDGIPEIKEFIFEITGLNKDDFIVGGNSSLSMMFDAISFFMTHGTGGYEPWGRQGKIKFLCPAPGYDRHFAITEYFDMELITVPMTPKGPDMDFVENAVQNDPLIKGIWCVPKYSNPQGVTYSDDTVRRFAKLKPAAPDFKIFWDNAYFVHDLTEKSISLLNIMDECRKYGTEELPLIFFSTSKITFPGAGIAFMACRGKNLTDFKKMYSIQTVGFDKINQLRHLKFLKDKTTLYSHMKKHREILKPKFNMINNHLKSEFKNNPILFWNEPKGGYFISVDTVSGCAKRVVQLCKEAGVILTGAGATFPYGKDPNDSNIRLAPTYPSEVELKEAIFLFCLCVKLAFLEKQIKPFE